MKISKIAIAALFAAGFVTASASAGFAEDKIPQILDCAVGHSAVYSEDGTSGSCEADAEVYVDYPQPIDSCWETEDGINVCARGGGVPMPTTLDDTPVAVDATDCMVTVDAEGYESTSCYDAVPFTTDEDGGMIEPVDGEVDESLLRDGEVDETLMYQSGVAMPASGSSDGSSNMLAAFGVLVGALGAFGIGISRQREAK
jgi:hypothetical protein